jgi:type IV pilus assembly protein PilE
MKDKAKIKGFTLIELMIVIAIVAILVALALPSYSAYIRKAKRGDAERLLMNWANVQEIWRANNPTYADDVAAPNGIPLPTHDYYDFSLGAPNPPSASAYLLIATPTGDQVNDKDRGKSCSPLSLDQSGAKRPQYDISGTMTTFCWGN